MKKCCFKNIDKAVRKGRAKYQCVKCGGNISLLWFFYMESVTPHKVTLPKNFGK